MSLPPPVKAQIDGLFSSGDNTFDYEIDDRVWVNDFIRAHISLNPELDLNIGSLIKVVQELQLVRVFLNNSIALGEKKKAPSQ